MNAPVRIPFGEEVRIAAGVANIIQTAGVEPDSSDFQELLSAECDIVERVTRLVRYARRLEADATALRAILDDGKARLARFEQTANSVRHAALWAMSEVGIPKISAPEFTVTSSRSRPPVVITDKEALPEAFWRVTREPSKTAIREALDAGQAVPGASYGNPMPQLRVNAR